MNMSEELRKEWLPKLREPKNLSTFCWWRMEWADAV